MATAVRAQDDDGFAANPGPPPPEPNPVQIDVPRGQAVLITLSAYSLTSPIIRYRIKRPPRSGRLGTPKVVSASTGVVLYHPPEGSGPGEDNFSYQVQSQAGVSAPADVEIKITDKDPMLITPGDIEFGQVLAGQSVSRTLDMQNIGGGVVEGEVQVPEGWTVQGDPSYRLTGGQKQTFTILFSPPSVGVYTGDVDYTGNPERATDLNGEGVAPIAVTTGTVELAQSGAIRLGTLEVKNRTATAQTLKLTPGPRLDVAQTAMVQANGTVDIEVQGKGDPGAIADAVTVEGAGTKTIVPVYGAALAMEAVPGSTPAASPGNSGAPNVASQSGPPAAGGQENPGTGTAGPEETGPGGTAAGIPVCVLGVGESTETTVEVGCNFKGAPVARSYRAETRSLKLDPQGAVTAQWTPFADAALTVNGPVVIAKLQNLHPGLQYVVRLVGLDQKGNVIEASGVQGVRTVAANKGWTWQWAVVGAVVLGVGGWFWRRRAGRGF
jgi:hypothetical protein